MRLELDPTHTIALEFSDFGSLYSADGREHPVNGQTPVYAVNAVDDSVRESPPATPAPFPPPPGWPNFGWPDWLTPDFMKKKHLFARAVMSIIAIAIIIVVALRLTR